MLQRCAHEIENEESTAGAAGATAAATGRATDTWQLENEARYVTNVHPDREPFSVSDLDKFKLLSVLFSFLRFERTGTAIDCFACVLRVLAGSSKLTRATTARGGGSSGGTNPSRFVSQSSFAKTGSGQTEERNLRTNGFFRRAFAHQRPHALEPTHGPGLGLSEVAEQQGAKETSRAVSREE